MLKKDLIQKRSICNKCLFQRVLLVIKFITWTSITLGIDSYTLLLKNLKFLIFVKIVMLWTKSIYSSFIKLQVLVHGT
jgi:hypothetical protein